MHHTLPGPGDLALRHLPDTFEGLADWEADEQASEDIASTGCDVAHWLMAECEDTPAALEPVCTAAIHDAQLQDAPTHVLLACIMTGTDRQAGFARMFLRDRFEAAHRAEIAQRAAELLCEANGPERDPSSIGCEFDD
jgi:hypothetical protein